MQKDVSRGPYQRQLHLVKYFILNENAQLSSKPLKKPHCTRSKDRPVLSCHKTNEHRNL